MSTTATDEPVDGLGTAVQQTSVGRDGADDEIGIDDELLVEEISIDGMCGVY